MATTGVPNYFGKGQGDCVKLLIDLKSLSCLHVFVSKMLYISYTINEKCKKNTSVSRIAKKGLKQAVVHSLESNPLVTTFIGIEPPCDNITIVNGLRCKHYTFSPTSSVTIPFRCLFSLGSPACFRLVYT